MRWRSCSQKQSISVWSVLELDKREEKKIEKKTQDTEEKKIENNTKDMAKSKTKNKNKINEWPRHGIQALWALITNSHLSGFVTGKITQESSRTPASRD